MCSYKQLLSCRHLSFTKPRKSNLHLLTWPTFNQVLDHHHCHHTWIHITHTRFFFIVLRLNFLLNYCDITILTGSVAKVRQIMKTYVWPALIDILSCPKKNISEIDSIHVIKLNFFLAFKLLRAFKIEPTDWLTLGWCTKNETREGCNRHE